MARSTIQDVAKLAGVSEATVSRALRGLTNVAPATRERVEAAAAELRFTLSKSASSLASGKTHRILLLVSGGLNNWFNSSVLQGAIEILSPEGYDIVPSFVTNSAELSRLIETLPSNRDVDAIIVTSFTLDAAFRAALASLDMPLVGINNPDIDGLNASVRIDDLEGMRQAVQLLHSLGHERLAYIGNLIPPTWTTAPICAAKDSTKPRWNSDTTRGTSTSRRRRRPTSSGRRPRSPNAMLRRCSQHRNDPPAYACRPTRWRSTSSTSWAGSISRCPNRCRSSALTTTRSPKSRT